MNEFGVGIHFRAKRCSDSFYQTEREREKERKSRYLWRKSKRNVSGSIETQTIS